MPVQAPQWSDVLCCGICCQLFNGSQNLPISLACGHSICKKCLLKLKPTTCTFDQTAITLKLVDIPVNACLLKIIGFNHNEEGKEEKIRRLLNDDYENYAVAESVLFILAQYFKRAASEKGGAVYSPALSRPLQRKLIALLTFQLLEDEGRLRGYKAARSVGERCLTELLLMHQNPYHLTSNLWAAVRSRGCQFLGPAMQEEVLKLVLLALSDGAAISRKVLVMYIVQSLEKDYPQASKTSVGHVVQLLYRASCFNVLKRDAESSLMQLKEEFRNYEALRREHDSQIVLIALEAGLRISPDQWSSLLYGDTSHKSHMQSIIDKLQTPQTFTQSIQELLISLQRANDPDNLASLRPHLETLADIDPSQENTTIPTWEKLVQSYQAVQVVVEKQMQFCQNHAKPAKHQANAEQSQWSAKFKTSLCRDVVDNRVCPRGEACTFAHSVEEMERYRARSRLMSRAGGFKKGTPNVAAVAPMQIAGSIASTDHGTAGATGLNYLEMPTVTSVLNPAGISPLAGGNPMSAAVNPNAPLGFLPASVIPGGVGPGFVPASAIPGGILAQPHVPAASLRFAFVQPQMQTGAGAAMTPQFRSGDPSTDYNCMWFPSYLPMGNASRAHVVTTDVLHMEVPLGQRVSGFPTTVGTYAIVDDFGGFSSIPVASGAWETERSLKIAQLQRKREEILKRLCEIEENRKLQPGESTPAPQETADDVEASEISLNVATSVLPILYEDANEMVTGSGTDNSKPLAVTTVTSAIQAQINQRSIKNFDDGNATQNNENRPNFKRLNSDTFMKDNDQIIPFSIDEPAVSRYGPISRITSSALRIPSGVIMTAAGTDSLTSSSDTVTKSVLKEPLSASCLQPTRNSVPETSIVAVDPSQIVNDIPAVFKAQSPAVYPMNVSQTIDRKLELQDMLNTLPNEQSDNSSAVEKAQLKLELYLIEQKMQNLGEATETECLLSELHNVNTDLHTLEHSNAEDESPLSSSCEE